LEITESWFQRYERWRQRLRLGSSLRWPGVRMGLRGTADFRSRVGASPDTEDALHRPPGQHGAGGRGRRRQAVAIDALMAFVGIYDGVGDAEESTS
jgi:hypothetical protein